MYILFKKFILFSCHITVARISSWILWDSRGKSSECESAYIFVLFLILGACHWDLPMKCDGELRMFPYCPSFRRIFLKIMNIFHIFREYTLYDFTLLRLILYSHISGYALFSWQLLHGYLKTKQIKPCVLLLGGEFCLCLLVDGVAQIYIHASFLSGGRYHLHRMWHWNLQLSGLFCFSFKYYQILLYMFWGSVVWYIHV